MARIKQLSKWVGLALAGVLLLAGLALLMAYGYQQTDSGRDRVARALERLISTPGKLEIHLDRLSSRIPFEASVGSSGGCHGRLADRRESCL